MAALAGQYQNAAAACQPQRLSLVDRLVALIAPWRCVLCGERAQGMDLCIDCLNDLPWLGPACARCAQPLQDPAGSLICGACAGSAGNIGQRAGRGDIDSTLAALAYDFPVGYLIAGLKYRRREYLARVLGELLAIRLFEAAADGQLLMPDVLVPVPLHTWREFRRGYNQAALLARAVGRELHLPVSTGLVRRVRNTPPQTGLSRSRRQRNLRGAFRARRLVDAPRIALIDDVLTTGATVREVAHTLRRAGAQSISVWCIARASA